MYGYGLPYPAWGRNDIPKVRQAVALHLSMMNRRKFLATLTAVGSSAGLQTVLSRRSVAERPRTSMGITIYSFQFRHFRDTIEFLNYCHSLGAGGAQVEFSFLDADYITRVRRRAEELGMYLEVITGLPQEGSDGFERTVEAAQHAGALCLRTACLGGRRYETFSSREEWKKFVTHSKAGIGRALPILEKHRMPMGIENHKDWTAEELVGLMKQHSSEYLGVCLDTGNNIALLDDPMEVVEYLAPYALNTHLKDMAVEEYKEGFLLSEVAMGNGILDMPRIVKTISKARPRARFTLEMITRNPLKIPCRTDKYWVTFAERRSTHLEPMLGWVRGHKPPKRLLRLDNLTEADRLRLEEENVRACLAYAREQLGLRVQRQGPEAFSALTTKEP